MVVTVLDVPASNSSASIAEVSQHGPRSVVWVPPTADLKARLREFQKYFNEHRTHVGLEGRLPNSGGPRSPISFVSYRWQKHCRGLYQTPIAA